MFLILVMRRINEDDYGLKLVACCIINRCDADMVHDVMNKRSYQYFHSDQRQWSNALDMGGMNVITNFRGFIHHSI